MSPRSLIYILLICYSTYGILWNNSIVLISGAYLINVFIDSSLEDLFVFSILIVAHQYHTHKCGLNSLLVRGDEERFMLIYGRQSSHCTCSIVQLLHNLLRSPFSSRETVSKKERLLTTENSSKLWKSVNVSRRIIMLVYSMSLANSCICYCGMTCYLSMMWTRWSSSEERCGEPNVSKINYEIYCAEWYPVYTQDDDFHLSHFSPATLSVKTVIMEYW